MRAVLVWMILVSFSGGLFAQQEERNYNIYVTMSPTVTFQNRFAGGATQVISPDNQTGVNTLYPLYSVLDGFPNPQLKWYQNFARKFTWGILFEKYLSKNQSFNLGFEIGSRGYKLHSERSVSSLISYRNLSVPVYFSNYLWLGSFWTLKFNYGGHINYAWSIPKSNRVVQIQKSPELYPTVGGGVEMAYMGKEGKLSFELAYYHGWRNIIDHVYIGVDNNYGERIYATGSHLRLSLKYNFKRLGRDRKHKPPKPVSIVREPEPDPFTGRTLKEPETLEVKHTRIRLCFLDDQTVDGDSIRVLWNDSLVAEALSLTASPLCIDVELVAGNNRLIVHALNEGKIKPNTYEIRIEDGEEALVVRMKSDMENSAVLDIRQRP